MDPCTIVIFGATGDLARQKLIPALYLLHSKGNLHAQTRIVLTGRREYTAQSLAAEYRSGIADAAQWQSFVGRLSYHRLEFHEAQDYRSLKDVLAAMPKNRLFYLATPQDAFPIITAQLSRAGLAQRKPRGAWHRVVFEKPFGSDLRSARALNKEVTRLFAEEQIYRIDHYLGKSSVQEVLVLRFANPIFENIWNSRCIERVEITISENQGIGTRGTYYDNAGAIRDMLQNHLLQLLALVAMDPPKSLDAEEIRDRKAAVLRNVRVPKNALICGQYTAGAGIPAYRKEANVRPGSKTETFALAKLELRDWPGTPFYLRTGKAMRERYAEIMICFRSGRWLKLTNKAGGVDHNTMVIRLQPEEGVRIQFNLADEPGSYVVRPRTLEFTHEAARFNSQEAYERLLADAIRGDRTLFTRWDFVEQSWRIADALRGSIRTVHPYPAGTDGPKAAQELFRARR